MSKIQLTHYGRKGIYAYLSPIHIANGQIKRGEFINGEPTTEDKERYHRGKSATVEIDLSKIPDGFYEYKEASGHKTVFGFLKISSGEIQEEYEDKSEVIEAMFPLNFLPKLEGSERQAEWADTIRRKAIRLVWEQGWLGCQEDLVKAGSDLPVQAKWWIDNKDAAKDAARKHLGFEYNTPAGADY